MCSGSEAGSYLRLVDFVYHSTLGLRVTKKRHPQHAPTSCTHSQFEYTPAILGGCFVLGFNYAEANISEPTLKITQSGDSNANMFAYRSVHASQDCG